jgi:excinuclease ABC subunit A
MKEETSINVYGARVHNLKDIDCVIPHHSLTVITGLSGSGKSSLAFDTIFAEGQRRYIETFSAYARNFLGGMERPDVDKITGLSPVISIEQKTTNKNPRSTVGTTTEIYDYLRLLFARAGRAYSYATGEEMVKYTEERVVDMILHDYAGRKIFILAPLVRSRKGHYRELFESMRRKGYLNIRVDGQMMEITRGMKVDRYKNHDIEVVIDKLQVPPLHEGPGEVTPDERLKKSVAIAMKQGDGLIMILDKDTGSIKHFSKRLMCPTTGISYSDPAPNNFSFNSPQGACPHCKGLGVINEIDLTKVMPDRRLSIYEGGIVPLGKYKNQMIFWQVEAILKKYDYTLKTPIAELPDDAIREVLYGSLENVRIDKELVHTSSDYFIAFDGIIKYLRNVMDNDDSTAGQKWADQFLAECECPECHGQRLNREALSYRFGGKNIAELAAMDISELREWIVELEENRGYENSLSAESNLAPPHPRTTAPPRLTPQQYAIAQEILKEIRTRLDFLLDVGLDYLSLNRQSASLSGGESQRIRLATQIGSQLVNVLYILDEPSIGLHQRDNQRLIQSLKQLRDLGNTVIVVEHDEDMMRNADWIIDIGPRAGRKGGEVVFQGTPAELLKSDTLTAQYLKGKFTVDSLQFTDDYSEASEGLASKSTVNRKLSTVNKIRLAGCSGNNLKHIDVEFPLGKLILVTGVSGSGKSTLINETLQPILSHHFYHSLKRPMPYDSIEGLEYIDKVVNVDQSPIGRTPRSNPATYTGVFADIRSLFVNLPEAKIRGYKPGRFSFNVKGGRCETCGGNGYKTIEMNFLPDIQVPCEACHGKRYNRETLEVRYKGKSIADVLDMTINQAVEFFENVPDILRKIKTIQDVGLGYIKLGQPSTTLSGGESQRIKLATELSKKDTGQTLYILDEPTTGLHFEDIRILMQVLRKLVARGNTVIVIEHNLDVIRQADWIIDMGPEGGRKGGQILTVGTPAEVAQSDKGYTPKYLKK